VLQGVARCCRVLCSAVKYYGVLQGVVVCCSVLLGVALCCWVLLGVAVCCSVLQCVAVCCSVLQYVAVCCSVLQSEARARTKGVIQKTRCVLQRFAGRCSVLQCVLFTVLQCVAVRSARPYEGSCYGVATISMLLKSISLFCRISSLLQGSFAKETCQFKEPTNRSHPIKGRGGV
jgi:hypothetical protein